MKRLCFVIILAISSLIANAQEDVFQGKVDFSAQIKDFATREPVPGVMYLFTGGATSVKILQEAPFSAEVGFLQGSWTETEELKSVEIVLSFSGDGWKKWVKVKKPRSDFEDLVFPYQRFLAAVQFKEKRAHQLVFKVLHIQILK